MYISIMALPFQLPVDDTNGLLALKPRAIIRKTECVQRDKEHNVVLSGIWSC